MASVKILDNVFEKDSLRECFVQESEFKTLNDAVLSLAGDDAYAGKLVECYNPKTDETTYESMSGDSLSVALFANGVEVGLEYEIKDCDEILIIVLPAGNGARTSAGVVGGVVGLVVGVLLAVVTAGIGAAVAGAGFAAGASAAFGITSGVVASSLGTTIMFALGGALAGAMLGMSIYDMNHRPDTDKNNGLEGKTYPGVKGAKNQSLLGKPYPCVLGRHLITPPYAAKPYSRCSGKFGQDQYIYCLFVAGYAPLRLTEFKLGELLLAYNKPTNTAPGRPTIMSGAFNANSQSTETGEWVKVTGQELNELRRQGVIGTQIAEYKYKAPLPHIGDFYPIDTYVKVKVYAAKQSGYKVKLPHLHGNVNTATLPSKQEEVRWLSAGAYLNEVGQYNDPPLGTVYKWVSSGEPGTDNGEILQRWNNNDVALEILQQNPDGNADYGTVFPNAVMQDEVNATPLYICDGLYGAVASEHKIEYHGFLFDNGFRNNTVRFSRSNPMKVEIELEAPNGLYRTCTYTTDEGDSTVLYQSISCWYAIQWRPYKAGASDSDVEWPSNNSDNPWFSFDSINNGRLTPSTFTSSKRDADWALHLGNTREGLTPSTGWIGTKLFDLGHLADKSDCTEKDKISSQRFTATVDLSYAHDGFGGAQWLRENILNIGLQDTESGNTNGTIEVRVVRVSPCYINMTKGTKNLSAEQYVDIVKWNTITTYPFDEKELSKSSGYALTAKKPMPEDELRKLCVIGFRCKADTGGSVNGQLDKVNCVAESLNPYFSETDEDGVVSITPSDIHKENEYYDLRNFNSEVHTYSDIKANPGLFPAITKERYEELMQEASAQNQTPKVLKKKSGNGFCETLLRQIYSEGRSGNRVLFPDSMKPHLNNNSALVSLTALLGKHNGQDAVGYEDLNLDSFSDMYEFCKGVEDGSIYKTDETVFLDDLSTRVYKKDDVVSLPYKCNAYVTNGVKSETLFQKCVATGRSLFVRDENNKIKVVVDKKKDFPVMLINQQNTISGTNYITYEGTPSGFCFNFEDESDGYTGHTLYVMDDGEDYKKPLREVETCSIDFITNRHQLYSMGRYLLAQRKLGRESLVRKVGPEGFCADIGSLVKVCDDTILIGSDLGARIKEVIENDNSIFGFVTDETYEFTGKTEDYEYEDEGQTVVGQRSVQGVEVLQPTRFGASRVIVLRLALNGASVQSNWVAIKGNIYRPTLGGTVTVNGETYQMVDNRETKKSFDGFIPDWYFLVDGECCPVKVQTYKMAVGQTNVVLFDKPISKNDEYVENEDSQLVYYKPEVDNIVAFGEVGKTSALYVVTKVKPDKDNNYELTLIQYNEGIYTAGAALPEFNANLTIPDRKGEDYYALRDGLSVAEMQQLVSDNVQGSIERLSDGTEGITAPTTPVISMAKAHRDGISLELAPFSSGARNAIKQIDWQVAKRVFVPLSELDENAWVDLPTGQSPTSSISTEYIFDRDPTVDGYPEAEDLNGNQFKWYFRAKATNLFGKESEWSEGALVDVSAYGTWKVSAPDKVTDRVSGRTATLAFDQAARSDGKEVYGDIFYKIEIRRGDSGDHVYYNPADNEDPYASEENYKNDGESAIPASDDNTVISAANAKSYFFAEKARDTSHAFTQTLPLEGQNDQLYQHSWWFDCGRTDTFGHLIKDGCGSVVSNFPLSQEWQAVNTVFGQDNQESDDEVYGQSKVEGGVLTAEVYGNAGETGEESFNTKVFKWQDVLYELRDDDVFCSEGGIVYVLENERFSVNEFTFEIDRANSKITVTWTPEGSSVQNSEDIPITNAVKHLSYSLEDGQNPIDTTYVYKVRAFNSWGRDIVSWSTAETFIVTALATSAKDVVNNAITSTKLAKDAVHAENIAAGAISADKLAVRDLSAITGVFGKIQNNKLESSSYNYWDLETGKFHIGNRESIEHPNSDESQYLEFDPVTDSMTIKIANFIVRAVESILNGLFRIRNKSGTTKKNIFIANPEAADITQVNATSYEESESLPGVTARFNGDVQIKAGTVTDQNGTTTTRNGDLSVDGNATILGGLSVGGQGVANGLSVIGTSTMAALKVNSIEFRGHSNELVITRMRVDGSTLYIN